MSQHKRPLALQLSDMTGLIGGLVTQEIQRRQSTRYAWASLGLVDAPLSHLPTPPAECWRSVSQRTQSHPVTWLGQTQFDPTVSNPYEAAMIAAELPREPLVDVNSVDFAQIAPFYDNDDQVDRARLDNLVLIGLRAELVAAAVGRSFASVDPDRYQSDEYNEAIPNFARHYLSFRIAATPTRRDPWVIDTPLDYLWRADRRFVAVPPLIWSQRDVTCNWVSRPPDGSGTTWPCSSGCDSYPGFSGKMS